MLPHSSQHLVGDFKKTQTFIIILEKGNITFFTWMKKQRGQRMMSSRSQRIEQRLKKNTQSVLVQHWRSSWKPEIVSCVMITEHHMGGRRGWESLSASHKNPHSNKPGEGVFPADFFPHHLFERVGHQTSKYAAWPDILVFRTDRQGSCLLKASCYCHAIPEVYLEGFLSQLSPYQSPSVLLREEN